MEEINIALHSLLVVVITGVIGLVGAYATLLMKRLSNRIDKEAEKISDTDLREKAQDAIFNINEVITNTVFALQVTLVKELKAKAEDGKLTAEEAEMIFNIAKQQISEQISGELLESASHIIDDIDGYITNKIETELQEIKNKLM